MKPTLNNEQIFQIANQDHDVSTGLDLIKKSRLLTVPPITQTLAVVELSISFRTSLLFLRKIIKTRVLTVMTGKYGY